jgi:hypothetical protein
MNCKQGERELEVAILDVIERVKTIKFEVPTTQ